MPTGVDPAETGEAFEDNAMPWDSINAATYSKTGDMVPFEPELLKDHQQRIAQNPEFQYIAQDIAHYKALKDNATSCPSIWPCARKRTTMTMRPV